MKRKLDTQTVWGDLLPLWSRFEVEDYEYGFGYVEIAVSVVGMMI